MQTFSLAKQPALLIEPGAARNIGKLVTEISMPKACVLLVVDPALVQMGLAEPVVASLQEVGHDVEVFADLHSDPSEGSVDAATKMAHEMHTNCVVGLGGGSAMDAAKVVAVLTDPGEACAPFRLGETPLPFRKTGLICMPTTAGTGSETTGTSIISQSNGVKNWFWGSQLKPDLALLDPELTLGLPPYWTFFTGMDALVHAIESRTNRYRFEENDVLAERAIVLAMSNLENAVQDPGNIEARSGMMLAAAYAGLAIGNTGCAVAHNIGHALGSIAGVPHGRAVSIALLATLDWVIEGNREAFDRVAVLLGGRSAGDIAPILQALADRCGHSLLLTHAEQGELDVDILAADMVADANVSMLRATARDATHDDVRLLAQMMFRA